jgi:DNA-binding CsgD family transcriptional regulator
MAGRGESRASRRRIQAREREAEALKLKRAGETYESIGAQLSITHEGARKAVLRALDRLPQPAAEELRSPGRRALRRPVQGVAEGN